MNTFKARNGGPTIKSSATSSRASVVMPTSSETWSTLARVPVLASSLVRRVLSQFEGNLVFIIDPSIVIDIVWNHMAGIDGGVGVAGSSFCE